MARFVSIFRAREDARAFFAVEKAAESFDRIVEDHGGRLVVMQFVADRDSRSRELLSVGNKAIRYANRRDIAEAA